MHSDDDDGGISTCKINNSSRSNLSVFTIYDAEYVYALSTHTYTYIYIYINRMAREMQKTFHWDCYKWIATNSISFCQRYFILNKLP